MDKVGGGSAFAAPAAKTDWANPTPAGLVALSVACFCFFALLNGFVDSTALPLLGAWLIGGFVVQFVVGLLDLKGANHAGGNTFLFFSAFFMLVGGIGMFVKHDAALAGLTVDGRIDGFAWMALTITLLLWTPAFLKRITLLSVVILALDVALPFITLMDLKVISGDFAAIPAYALLASAVAALYLAAAQVVNGAYGRKVYPLLDCKGLMRAKK